MNSILPLISIVIPTHNRIATLKRNLNAFKAQSYPISQIEVVIVADGCTDSTVEVLQNYEAPFSLQLVEQTGQGAAVARNCGASCAKGTLLLFLDDDIETTPGLVKAHVNAHQKQSNRVVIGYLPPVLQNQTGFFRSKLRGWWEAMFSTMRRDGHCFSYRDLLSGNFSMPAELFHRIGGFDPSFKCQEDYELGVRLIKAGADFYFAEDALGHHHEMTDLNRSLQRKYQEGKASVQLGQKYPELISTFPVLSLFESQYSFLQRILLFFVFQHPTISDWIATSLHTWINVLEFIKARGSWHQLLDQLLGYWFMRGVADALGTQSALTQFLETKPTTSVQKGLELQVDLKEGLDTAEQLLNTFRPASLRIYYGQHPVGYIPLASGRERLRGEHLRPFLANYLASPLLLAIAIESGTNTVNLNLSLTSADSVTLSQETIYAH